MTDEQDDLPKTPQGVTAIGDWLFTHKPALYSRWMRDGCKHQRLTIDDHGETVVCDTCKLQVTPYWALRNALDSLTEARHKVRSRQERLHEEASKTLHLRAAVLLERAWRSRSMYPACPHCHRGIGPQDRFGTHLVNKQIEDEKRRAEAKPTA